MSLRTIGDIVNACSNGQTWSSFVHKTTTPTPGAGYWGDMSMGAGTPIYNAYVGGQYEATQLIGSKNQGIHTGATPPAGMEKYLAQIGVMTPTITNGPPMSLHINDYLMCYPLIDGDSLDQQDMINEVSLPRYTDGVGVRAFIVVTTPMTGTGTTTIGYTDCDDVDRTMTIGLIGSGTVGVIVGNSSSSTSANAKAPFIPIDGRGLKRINYVTNLSSMGGFFCIVLCRPLTRIHIREGGVWTEHCLISQKLMLPRIYDGAYLNMLALTSASGNPSTIRGQFDFVWG